MIDIEMHEFSQEFANCWNAAGTHIQNQPDAVKMSWLRSDLCPPFLEHLSFRMGNQLFFVRIEDVGEELGCPGTEMGLQAIANGCKGHACLMPMRKNTATGAWEAERPGWGLIDARTRASIDPSSLVTDEKIEMTPWELHDFGIQIVRQQLEKEGRTLMSWQGNPKVDPAIWFIGDSKGPEWIVVRVVCYPEKRAKRPDNWAGIAANCGKLSKIGHFASLAFASADETFERASTPLWRGQEMHVNYGGLEQ